MARGNIYGQSNGGGIRINNAITTTSMIETGNTINKYDIISYNDNNNIIERQINDNVIIGDTYIFNSSGATSYISAVSLTDTKVLICYKYDDYGKAIVINIDGNNITSGSSYLFSTC